MVQDNFGSHSLRTNRELLSPAVASDESHQSTWDVVRDGLWQGLQDRGKQAQENSVATSLEFVGSAGIAAGLVQAANAGGRWRFAAELAGTVLTLVAGADLFNRGMNIGRAYGATTDDTAGNAIRKDAIAKNAGSGIFDYALMFSGGSIGAGGALKASIARPIEFTQPGSARITFRSSDRAALAEEGPKKGLDVEKVSDDMAYSLDYNISRTAMEKISESLQKANPEEFNGLLRRLEEKDRKFQGMDLQLTNWSEVAQRWESAKLHHTDENMTTYMIVQRGDTAARIAELETRPMQNRTEDDITFYRDALIRKNKISDPDNLLSGSILRLPFAS